MACDAATLAVLIGPTDGLSKLSDYDLLVCLASIYGSNAGFSTAQAALTNAVAMGMMKVSDHDLQAILEAAIC